MFALFALARAADVGSGPEFRLVSWAARAARAAICAFNCCCFSVSRLCATPPRRGFVECSEAKKLVVGQHYCCKQNQTGRLSRRPCGKERVSFVQAVTRGDAWRPASPCMPRLAGSSSSDGRGRASLLFPRHAAFIGGGRIAVWVERDAGP